VRLHENGRLIDGIKSGDLKINSSQNKNKIIIGNNSNMDNFSSINMPKNNSIKIKLNKKDGYAAGGALLGEGNNQIKDDIEMKNK
jgi:hypothetical protein